jgi:hypothetical protein
MVSVVASTLPFSTAVKFCVPPVVTLPLTTRKALLSCVVLLVPTHYLQHCAFSIVGQRRWYQSNLGMQPLPMAQCAAAGSKQRRKVVVDVCAYRWERSILNGLVSLCH